MLYEYEYSYNQADRTRTSTDYRRGQSWRLETRDSRLRSRVRWHRLSFHCCQGLTFICFFAGVDSSTSCLEALRVQVCDPSVRSTCSSIGLQTTVVV
eukprot:scaffold36855_cov13-Prasinocladus_malaysianus.AAC.1